MTLQYSKRGVTATRIQELREDPVRGEYSLAHLQVIHKQVFWDVYEQAGKVYKADIAEGPASGRTLFIFKEDIPQKAQEVRFAIKEANYLYGMDKEQFSEKITEIYADVNEMHPFHEGNGRTTRKFIRQPAEDVGYQLDYPRVDKRAWNEAAKEFAHGNLESARGVSYKIMAVEWVVAFDKLVTREALAEYPGPDDTYKILHDAYRTGQDATYLRVEIPEELHNGRLMGGDVTLSESKRVIGHTVAYRGLMVRGAERLDGQFKGEMVAVSSHHAMLQVDNMIAIHYEHVNLDRGLAVGNYVAIQYDKACSQVYEQDKGSARDRSDKDMQMEHERVPTSH